MKYYYKDGDSYLVAKHELSEEELGQWEPITEEEYNLAHPKKQVDKNLLKIAQLKQELAATDYQCLKWSEGWLTDEEYAPIKAHRQELRDEINALENSTVIEGGN